MFVDTRVQIAIVDYGMGNLNSIVNMFKKLGIKAIVTADHEVLARAERLILPGVGAFDAGMRNLHERNLISILGKRVMEDRTPVLGLCLGMQLLTNRSEEGALPGLGWIHAETTRFKPQDVDRILPIPHMGWNVVNLCRSHPLFINLETDNRFYFVHSYHVVPYDAEDILGQTLYGRLFVSSVGRNNILGVQFHPEKSHRFGMQLLQNFSDWECS